MFNKKRIEKLERRFYDLNEEYGKRTRELEEKTMHLTTDYFTGEIISKIDYRTKEITVIYQTPSAWKKGEEEKRTRYFIESKKSKKEEGNIMKSNAKLSIRGDYYEIAEPYSS